MKCEHLGQIENVDPKRAALENSMIAALRRHGPMRQKDLWYRAHALRLGEYSYARPIFNLIVESLVESGTVIRQTTNRRNSFILKLKEVQ